MIVTGEYALYIAKGRYLGVGLGDVNFRGTVSYLDDSKYYRSLHNVELGLSLHALIEEWGLLSYYLVPLPDWIGRHRTALNFSGGVSSTKPLSDQVGNQNSLSDQC